MTRSARPRHRRSAPAPRRRGLPATRPGGHASFPADPRPGLPALDGDRASGTDTVVVERLVLSSDECTEDELDLKGRLRWELALDQRVFGPRRMLVAGADAGGRLRELVHTPRTDVPELDFALCLRTLGDDVSVVVAYSDEPVDRDAPESELDHIAERFIDARTLAHEHFGMCLVDWIACDDQIFRSAQLLAEPDRLPWMDR